MLQPAHWHSAPPATTSSPAAASTTSAPPNSSTGSSSTAASPTSPRSQASRSRSARIYKRGDGGVARGKGSPLSALHKSYEVNGDVDAVRAVKGIRRWQVEAELQGSQKQCKWWGYGAGCEDSESRGCSVDSHLGDNLTADAQPLCRLHEVCAGGGLVHAAHAAWCRQGSMRWYSTGQPRPVLLACKWQTSSTPLTYTHALQGGRLQDQLQQTQRQHPVCACRKAGSSQQYRKRRDVWVRVPALQSLQLPRSRFHGVGHTLGKWEVPRKTARRIGHSQRHRRARARQCWLVLPRLPPRQYQTQQHGCTEDAHAG
jgi:hypothetical protein